MNKKIIITGIFTAFALYGCGHDAPASDNVVVYYEYTDTQTETTTEHSTQNNADRIKLEVDSNSDKVSFSLADGSNVFERYNGYTGEVAYRFDVESVKLDVKEYEFIENRYSIDISLTGKKTYDCKGDDAMRNLQYSARILDSNGVVIESSEKFSKYRLKVEDRLEEAEIDINFLYLDLEPGEYTIDIFQQPDTYVELASENTKYLNPERWYPLIVHIGGSNDSAYDFDTKAQWVYEYSLRNIYIDDNLILHNVFNEPYDLTTTEYEVQTNESDYGDFYSDTYYYDITDFDKLLSGVPEEAMPREIRVTYSPGGSSINGERPAVIVAFIYREDENDKRHGSIAFWSKKGANLTQEEWDMVLSNTEKAGIDKSWLAVISD